MNRIDDTNQSTSASNGVIVSLMASKYFYKTKYLHNYDMSIISHSALVLNNLINRGHNINGH